MDVGGATRWSPEAVVSRREMLERLESHYGPVEPVADESSAPADRFPLPDGTTVRDHLLDDRAVLRDLRSQPG